MARLLTAGAEFNHIAMDGSVTGEDVFAIGAFNIVTTPVRSGGFAYSVSDSGDNCLGINWVGVHDYWYYGRVWIRFSGLPSSPRIIAAAYQNTISMYPIYIRPTGELSLSPNTGPVSAPITPNTWVCLDFATWANQTNAVQFVIRLDGVEFANFIADVLPNVWVSNFRIGWMGSGPVEGNKVCIDDIALNDDRDEPLYGAYENSWPSHNRKVVLLRPNEDGEIGFWTTGDGFYTGLWAAVNNTPPRGVARTNHPNYDKQIENADWASNVPDYVDLRHLPYSSKVPSGSIVRLVQAVISVGAGHPIQLDGAMGLVEAPAEDTFGFLLPNNLIAADTYPTRWTRYVGAPVPNPGVSFSERPVVRIRKLSQTAAALMCCAVGVTVEYEPDAAMSSRSRFQMVV